MYTKYLQLFTSLHVSGEYSNFHLLITNIAIFNSTAIHIIFNKLILYVPRKTM